MCAIKDVGFFMPHSFASRHAGPKPYTGRACLSPQRPSIGVHRPCLFPAWITHLPTPQGCGQPFRCVSYRAQTDAFRVDKSSICPPSSCPGLRRFLKISIQNSPGAPSLFGRQIAGARARERTGGTAQGAGGHAPTPGAALGGGGTRGKAAKRPLCSAPWGLDMVPRRSMSQLRSERIFQRPSIHAGFEGGSSPR